VFFFVFFSKGLVRFDDCNSTVNSTENSITVVFETVNSTETVYRCDGQITLKGKFQQKISSYFLVIETKKGKPHSNLPIGIQD